MKQLRELEVERTYEPGTDTEDRVTRALAILLEDKPQERPGEDAA